MRAIRSLASVTALLLASSACEPTIQVTLKVVQPCDQSDALEGAGTMRFEITGQDIKALASNFSRGNNSGHITGLPLGEDIQVLVKAYAGDVEKSPDVLNAAPLATGASQPRDYTAEADDRSVEIYVPVGKVDTFASTTDAAANKCTAMSQARHGHTATYLPKVGKVLIVGGAVLDEGGQEAIRATAELYDPATGIYTDLPEPPGGPRVYHAAVALPDGRALISGGIGMINNNLQTLGSGFVYDPYVTGNRSPYTLVVMPTHQARAHHTATLSSTGNVVLLVGGCTNSSGQVCTRNSANNAFDSTLIFDIALFDNGNTALVPGPELPDGAGRVFHTAVSLSGEVNDGRILIAGGHSGGAAPAPVCRVLVFDARQNAFLQDVNDTLTTEGCTSHLASAVLEDGRVLLTGGYKSLNADGSPPSDAAEMSNATTIWDAGATVRLANGPILSAARAEHAAFALPGGEVLVVGGLGGGTVDSERVDLTSQQATATDGFPTSQRVSMGAVALGSGQVLLLGGIDPTDGVSGTTQAAGELFFYTR